MSRLVGLWHLAAVYGCGYKVLPMYQRSACGSQVHQLAYITEHERHQLMAAGGSGKAQPGTQGVPCYPNKRKREHRVTLEHAVALQRREIQSQSAVSVLPQRVA